MRLERAAWMRHLPWMSLVALSILVYLPALGAGYIWDDGVVTANPLVAEDSGLARLWLHPSENPNEPHYWPVVYTTFWLEHRVWGTGAFGHHLDNVLLHAVAVLLVWVVLRRVEVPHAWWGAALFAVHPVHVESVAWVAERKDVLSAVLYLAATIAYIGFDETRSARAWWSALVLFALALLSKSIVVTWPIAMLLVLWWKKQRLRPSDVRGLVPFALLAALLTAFDLWLFYDLSQSEHLTTPLADRLQLAGRALVFYAQKLLWPYPLASLYPKWRLDARELRAWWPYPALVAMAAGLWLGRRRIGRGAFVAAAYYALTLAPALGIMRHGFMAFAWVADRFQYLPSIAPLALIGAFVPRVSRASAVGRAIAAAVVLVLGALTWRQSALYVDHITLFRHNVDVYPESWTARAQLSGGLARAGRDAEAVEQLEEVLRQDPDERHTIHLEAGAMEIDLGRFDDAQRNIEAALRLVPDYAEAHYEYGRLHERRGRTNAALAEYGRSLELKPEFAPADDALQDLLARTRAVGP